MIFSAQNWFIKIIFWSPKLFWTTLSDISTLLKRSSQQWTLQKLRQLNWHIHWLLCLFIQLSLSWLLELILIQKSFEKDHEREREDEIRSVKRLESFQTVLATYNRKFSKDLGMFSVLHSGLYVYSMFKSDYFSLDI